MALGPPCSICERQLNPSVTISVSGAALADRRQQDALAGLHGDVVLVARLEAEGAGDAAAPRVEHLGVEAEALEHLAVAVHVRRRLLVAVHVHERPAAQRRRPPVRQLAREELAERGGQPRSAAWRPRRRAASVSSSRNTATQLGSSATTGVPAWISGRSAVEDLPQLALARASSIP